MQVDVSESGQGGCHAVQFIFKSFAFLLEFAYYRLHQCFWYEASYHSQSDLNIGRGDDRVLFRAR